MLGDHHGSADVNMGYHRQQTKKMLIFISVVCWCWPISSAYSITVSSILNRLTALGKGTQTFQAHFIQRKHLKLFRTDITSHGRIFFRRPADLRWEMLPPDASVFLIHGNMAEFRLPGEKPRLIDLQQNVVVASLVDQMLVWLGAKTPQFLTQQYKISVSEKSDLLGLLLIPTIKTIKNYLQSIELEMNRSDLNLRRISVHQKDGDTTTIIFSDFKRNVKLPAQVFN